LVVCLLGWVVAKKDSVACKILPVVAHKGSGAC
jgi:hypothetical protein